LTEGFVVAHASTWDRLVYLIRERPATCVILDEGSLPTFRGSDGSITELGENFPSVAQVLIARPATDPYALFRLGRAGVANLLLLRLDDLERDLPETILRALGGGAHSLVTRLLSPYLPARETNVLRLAFEGAQSGWTTKDLADRSGLTRPHLSVRLKAVGLPSAGHLLVWARLLLAAQWLADPGRSAESVSRQLEYSSGAALRRTLRNYVGVTPTAVREAGGLSLVLDRFLATCGLGRPRRSSRSVA
jgi:AraC-like DNA-binding protein